MPSLPSIPMDQFVAALADAFTRDEMDLLLRMRFDIRLDTIAPPGRWEYRVYQVIEAASAADWLQDLVEAAYRERPRHPSLAAVSRA